MKKYYFDMDGVLADFDGQPNAMKRFITEEGFFTKLAPTKLAKTLNEELINREVYENTYILSASPNLKADIDKMFWINQHLPNIKIENVIIVRGGKGADERKAKYANSDSVLFDDYSNNLITWEQFGGKGIKIVNKRNGKGIKWKGDRLITE
jgi:5'(3')-deoxyribonucleotidase